MPRPAVFMDRDGTVSEEVGYVNHLSRFRLLPRTAEAIRRLNQSEFLAVLVTNQAGVARGYFPEELVQQVHQHLQELLGREGARLDGIYYCPHHPDVGDPPYRRTCDCRKPKPGMIRAATRDLDIDLRRSVMVGDKHSDILFAHSMDLPAVLVRTGYGQGELQAWSSGWAEHPEYVADDLLDAVDWVLGEDGAGEAK